MKDTTDYMDRALLRMAYDRSLEIKTGLGAGGRVQWTAVARGTDFLDGDWERTITGTSRSFKTLMSDINRELLTHD